jgi:hypothetical protein
MMWIRDVLTFRPFSYKIGRRYKDSFLKIFETDKDGDFKDDRVVFVIFGTVILLTGLVEGIPV